MAKIELEYPYKSKWKYGYIVINKEPRRNVILYNNHKDRSSVSYARYMYEVSIGKFLPKDVFVDHINNNKLDDRLCNYQLLSNKENIIKGLRDNNKTKNMVDFICGTCKNIFTKQRKSTHLTITRNKSTYCSRKCAGKRLSLSIVIKEYTIQAGE